MNAEEISAGVRTVNHLVDYYKELKAKVIDFTERASPQDRGYFNPHEEDEVKALLVSHWQARNALYDLITSFRLEDDLSDEDRPAAFLTAFAAALVLIDAARFLRETTHDKPIVRRKLNEPIPQFGISGGSYDNIQKSLISARHAWHLYYAIRYFEDNEEDLRKAAAEKNLGSLINIIDQLKHRLDVSVAQYAKAKLRLRAGQVLRHIAEDVVGRALYGLQRIGMSMMSEVYLRRGHKPALPNSIAASIRDMLIPGDVLIVRKDYALTNYFLPGYWPHAALYLGDEKQLKKIGIDTDRNVRPQWEKIIDKSCPDPKRVLESMKDGVQIRSLGSPFSSDSMVVLRPKLTSEDIAFGIARILEHEGKRYDFDFDFSRADRLVCTEVVYRAFDGVGPLHFDLKQRAGRLTLSGSDLIHMGIEKEQFEPIAVYAPLLGKGLITGAKIESILKAGEKKTSADDAS